MKSFNKNLKRDLIKMACVLAVLCGAFAVFFITPSLSTPTALSLITTMLLSPLIASLERRGIHRTRAIFFMFALLAICLFSAGLWLTQSVVAEWDSLVSKGPEYFSATMEKIRHYETVAKSRFKFLENLNVTENMMIWGQNTGKQILTAVPNLVGDLFTWALVTPILTFVLLNDGNAIEKKIFEMIPNRFFESTVMVTTKVISGLSDYLRAKLIEALIVGVLTAVGLALVGAPYVIVLAIVAGITNILPYVGPIIGAIPGILVIAFDPASEKLLIPVLVVYSIANIIDLAFIFPILVAKLVDLHPLILMAAVIVGQHYYGLVGMLISIPLATSIKVLLQEIYEVIYEPVRDRSTYVVQNQT